MYFVRVKTILFVTLFLLINSVWAQNILVKELPTYSQLPVTNLHHITQDKEGYMWYGTDAGLCRDNGYQIDVFHNDIHDPNYWKSNRIMDLTVGKNDFIWTITTSGLYYLNKSNYNMHEVVHKDIPSTKLNFIFCASDGTIWVTGGKKIIHVTALGEVIRTYDAKNPGDGNKHLNQVSEDADHNIWLYECRGVLCKLDKRKDEFIQCDWPVNCEPYGGFVHDTKNKCFWISTWGKGVVKYIPGGEDGTKGTVEYQPCTIEGNTLNLNKSKIVSMTSTSNNRLIVCCAMDGLYVYEVGDDGKLHPFNTDGLLPPGKKVFAHMYRDAKDNIWVASYSPHTFILSPNNSGIDRYDIPEVFAKNDIQTIVENIVFEGDYAWIWHLRLNLMLHNRKTGESNIVLSNQHEDFGSNVMANRVSGDGIWSTRNNKIVLLQHEGMKVRCTEIAELDKVIRDLYEDNNGCLWVGTDSAIWSYDVNKKTVKKVFDKTGVIMRMRLHDKTKKLYFISEKLGLVEGNISNGKIRNLSEGIHEVFESLDISPFGDVCATTEVGSVYLFNIKQDKLLRTSNASLESNDEISDVAFDSSNHLWLLTRQYIKEFNPTTKTSRYIYASDSDIDLDYICHLQKVGNKMCIAGAGGYRLVPSSSVIDSDIVDVVPVVTSYVVDGKKHLISSSLKEISIAPDAMNVSVNFSTFNHLHADRIRFAYSLHTEDSEPSHWVELPRGHNTAYFVDINPGKYVLDVRATDAYGNWGEPIRCITIDSLPKWYETVWFYLAVLLFIIFFVYYIAHIYYRNKMQDLEIQKLVNLAKEVRESQSLRIINGATEVNVDDEPEEEPEDAVKDEVEEPVERVLTKAEQKFIADAKAMVEKNMSDSGYTTERFASDMCMSRMNLYRKIQKITGQKPSEFVRMIRLHTAAKMLREGDASVSAVAEAVGFSSPSYFTKCFKETFGMQPLQYHYYRNDKSN